MTDPTTDCPTCPACSLPTGVTEGHDCETLPPPRLRCAACGNLWDGTPEERARAERADAAHEASIRAEERAGLWGEVRRRNAMERDDMNRLDSQAFVPWPADCSVTVHVCGQSSRAVRGELAGAPTMQPGRILGVSRSRAALGPKLPEEDRQTLQSMQENAYGFDKIDVLAAVGD